MDLEKEEKLIAILETNLESVTADLAKQISGFDSCDWCCVDASARASSILVVWDSTTFRSFSVSKFNSWLAIKGF